VVHQTKTNLFRLLAEATVGKEVIIARDREPVAKIIAIGSGLSAFPVGSQAKFLHPKMRLRLSAAGSSMNSASPSNRSRFTGSRFPFTPAFSPPAANS